MTTHHARRIAAAAPRPDTDPGSRIAIRRPTSVLGIDREGGDIPDAPRIEVQLRPLEKMIEGMTPNGLDIVEALEANGRRTHEADDARR